MGCNSSRFRAEYLGLCIYDEPSMEWRKLKTPGLVFDTMNQFRCWCVRNVKGISISNDMFVIDSDSNEIRLYPTDPFFSEGNYIVRLGKKKFRLSLTRVI
jgi:hypothetical protein